MTIDVTWGRGEGGASVTTAAELDALLDTIPRADAAGIPYCVTLVVPGSSDFPVMLDICVGHPERSFVYQRRCRRQQRLGIPTGPRTRARLHLRLRGHSHRRMARAHQGHERLYRAKTVFHACELGICEWITRPGGIR
jgi:hypothetical protein